MTQVTAAHPCELFSPPLTPEQARTLETATKVALVRRASPFLTVVFGLSIVLTGEAWRYGDFQWCKCPYGDMRRFVPALVAAIH